MSDAKEFGLSSRETSSHREAPNRVARGSKKYSEMIARSSRDAEKKNLPFTISKPNKTSVSSMTCWCPECGRVSSLSKNTVMVVCCDCKKLYSVTEENSER
jgi:hypothetical protein